MEATPWLPGVSLRGTCGPRSYSSDRAADPMKAGVLVDGSGQRNSLSTVV